MSKAIPDEYWQQVKNVKSPNFTIYYGVEGLATPIALAPNNKWVYPLVRKNETKKEEKISPEIQQFMSKFDKIFVVSFGTTYVPTQEQLENIFHYIATNKDYGFIVGVKNRQYFTPETFDIIKHLSHVHLTRWYAQKEVLKHEKTKIFFTHGGYNSFLESVETRTAMISLPLWCND